MSARRIAVIGLAAAAALVLAGIGFHVLDGGPPSEADALASADAPVRDLTVLDDAETEELGDPVSVN